MHIFSVGIIVTGKEGTNAEEQNVKSLSRTKLFMFVLQKHQVAHCSGFSKNA